MPHPHQASLDEYQFAIDHLVPTVPEEIKKEAQKRHAALSADSVAEEQAVRDALIATGEAEYPHRKAYQELAGKMEAALREKLVLEHLEPPVQAKVRKYLDQGVGVDELVKSDLFESGFSPEERYQIEHGILDAKDHVREEMDSKDIQETSEYVQTAEKWRTHLGQIASKIDELEALKVRDKEGKWGAEIDGRVARFREGFLVTEQDPELEEVEKEIEYWIGTFGEEL